jgi:hypothetical protein
LNHRGQIQRPFALETEVIPGQKPGVIEIESLGSGAKDTDVAILVEDRESIAIFQTAQRSLDEGSRDFDIVLGQANRGVPDALCAALCLLCVVYDVRSPFGQNQI